MFNFYPYLQRFITPQQRDVTLVLQAAAHATHDLVPPEVINELSRCIANNFITDRNAGEVMAVGLNAVREVARRNPLALGEDLLQDLVQYKKHIDRGVTMAAKGIMQDYRQVAPQILAKKDRGKPTEASKQIVLAEYGSLQSKARYLYPSTFAVWLHYLHRKSPFYQALKSCQLKKRVTTRTMKWKLTIKKLNRTGNGLTLPMIQRLIWTKMISRLYNFQRFKLPWIFVTFNFRNEWSWMMSGKRKLIVTS